jgi:hypothetical protein
MVTPTQARASAINASRSVIKKASIALDLNAAKHETHVRLHRGDRKAIQATRRQKKRTANYAGSGLDARGPIARLHAMLQHNVAHRHRAAGKKAHIAHAAVMGLHAVCCGMPALAMLAAAVSGATSGVALLSETTEEFHSFLHAHELWILAASAALVVTGAWLEAAARRVEQRGFPWLFGFSVLCFLANAAIIFAHRG